MMKRSEGLREIPKPQENREARDHRQRRGAEQAAARRAEANGDGGEGRQGKQSYHRLGPEEAARVRIQRGAEHSDKPAVRTEVEARDQAERFRLIGAAEALRGNERLKPERWRGLNQYERREALHSAGKVLRDAYGCADPPVLPKDFPEYSGGKLLGYYSDGATKDVPEGAYELALNKALMASDNPRDTLDTYLHEFRHAYQHEMATRFEKPQFAHLVHDVNRAAEWSRNFHDYKNPPENMSDQHPDFGRLAEQYENQPIERDAREFSENLLREIYRV
jgi:hypothetical protein